jgi:hypothetical protein
MFLVSQYGVHAKIYPLYFTRGPIWIQLSAMTSIVYSALNSNIICTSHRYSGKLTHVTEMFLMLIRTVMQHIPSAKKDVLCESDNLIHKLRKTADSSGRRGPVTAWFRSARPSSVTSVPKTSTLLVVGVILSVYLYMSV